MRRLRAAHDEGKGGEAMEQGPQRQHGGEGWEEQREWAACPFSSGRAAATTQGEEEDERSPRPPPPPPPQESPRLPLLPAGPGYCYPKQQPRQLPDGGGEAQEEGEGGDPSVVIMDPEPLPRPPLHLGRRCLLPTRLQPGAPVQVQRALHSTATGRRYLFLRCLIKEKPRVMIMLAAVLRPVPTGSAQAIFPHGDMEGGDVDEEAAEARREQGIVWTPSGEKVVVKVTDRRVLAQECALNAAALAAAAHQTDDATSAAAAAAWSAAAFAGTGRCHAGSGGGDDPTGAGLNLLLENPFDEIGALALLQAGAWEMEDEEEHTEEEAAALRALVQEGKQHVSPVLDAMIDDENVYMVMPYFHGKDLYQKVEAYGKGVCEAKAAAIVRQVALGLLYMKRAHRIAHRDVSLENLMCDDRGNIRLIDLGMCVRVPRPPAPSSSYPASGAAPPVRVKLSREPRRGKAMYVCPETALELESDPFAGDAWSLGVVAYILLSHCPLYADPGDAAFALLLQDRCGELLAHYASMGITGLTPLATDLLVRTLRPNPEHRLTLEEILAHPWIQQHSPASPHPAPAPATAGPAASFPIPIPTPAAAPAAAAAAGMAAVSPPWPAAAAAAAAYAAIAAAAAAGINNKKKRVQQQQKQQQQQQEGGMMPPPLLSQSNTDPPAPWMAPEGEQDAEKAAAAVGIVSDGGRSRNNNKRLWAGVAVNPAPPAPGAATSGGSGGGDGDGGGSSKNITPTTPRFYPAGAVASSASAAAVAVPEEEGGTCG